MRLADNEINLNRYQCAQCRRTPENAQELFKGCVCGHRLFRILTQQNTPHSKIPRKVTRNPVERKKDNNFLTVHELEVGIYDINVEKLFDGKSGKKQFSPVVVGNEGVFSIHLQHHKKNCQPRSRS